MSASKLPKVDYRKAEELARRIVRELGLLLHHCEEAEQLQAEAACPVPLFHEQIDGASDRAINLAEDAAELSELLEAPCVALEKRRRRALGALARKPSAKKGGAK